jgi:hypothetical protein
MTALAQHAVRCLGVTGSTRGKLDQDLAMPNLYLRDLELPNTIGTLDDLVEERYRL